MQLPPIIDASQQRPAGSLSPNDTHARQVILPNVGINGQARIAQAHVTVVGAGALGSAALPILAAAGVGHLTIIDPDSIESTNLSRQLLYAPSDIGQRKAEVAAQRLQALAPSVHLTPISEPFSASLLDNSDLVLDATDNVSTRYEIDDAARQHGIPNVFGAALAYAGQWTVFYQTKTIDVGIRKIFPSAQIDLGSCSTDGIWTPVTQIVGSAMADQALRLIVGLPGVAVGTLCLYDSSTGQFDSIPLATE